MDNILLKILSKSYSWNNIYTHIKDINESNN